MPLPLNGVTVIAVEQALSAPFATRQLADMGARVLKVERVREGDFARQYDQEVHGMASHFVWVNRNKESIALDFKCSRGRLILGELIATADVVIQNLAPGTADSLGLSAAKLVARYPRLIACDISGYGEDGPYSAKRAYDLIVQAESASISTTGWPDRPAKPGIPIADVAAGLYTYSSVLAALYERERTGRGRAIAVRLLDAIAELMGYSIYFTAYSGRRHEPNGSAIRPSPRTRPSAPRTGARWSSRSRTTASGLVSPPRCCAGPSSPVTRGSQRRQRAPLTATR